MSALGHKRTSGTELAMSALPPNSGHQADRLRCPLSANSRHQRRRSRSPCRGGRTKLAPNIRTEAKRKSGRRHQQPCYQQQREAVRNRCNQERADDRASAPRCQHCTIDRSRILGTEYICGKRRHCPEAAPIAKRDDGDRKQQHRELFSATECGERRGLQHEQCQKRRGPPDPVR